MRERFWVAILKYCVSSDVLPYCFHLHSDTEDQNTSLLTSPRHYTRTVRLERIRYQAAVTATIGGNPDDAFSTHVRLMSSYGSHDGFHLQLFSSLHPTTTKPTSISRMPPPHSSKMCFFPWCYPYVEYELEEPPRKKKPKQQVMMVSAKQPSDAFPSPSGRHPS